MNRDQFILYADADLWRSGVFSLSFGINFFIGGFHTHLSLGFFTVGLDVVIDDIEASR